MRLRKPRFLGSIISTESSLLPLFKNPNHAVREFVYGEQGPARSIKTKDWNYISIRYTAEQIEEFNKQGAERFAKKLLGLSGGISRSRMEHPGAFDVDQLYHFSTDPDEMKNLAKNPEQKEKLTEMKQHLSTALEAFKDRPYGEFMEGGNARAVEESAPILKKLRRIEE